MALNVTDLLMKSERSWITVLSFQQRDGSHSHSICRYYKFIKLYSELFIYERNVLLVQDINRIHWLCQSSGYPGWHKKEDEVTKRWRCLHGTDSERGMACGGPGERFPIPKKVPFPLTMQIFIDCSLYLLLYLIVFSSFSYPEPLNQNCPCYFPNDIWKD